MWLCELCELIGGKVDKYHLKDLIAERGWNKCLKLIHTLHSLSSTVFTFKKDLEKLINIWSNSNF